MNYFDNLIDELGFELEMRDSETRFNSANVELVKRFVRTIEEDYAYELEQSHDAQNLLDVLKEKINIHENTTSSISKEDLKKVYLMLKNRELHPPGQFDKMGRFYLDDGELVDVRSPSARYPYSEMLAGRTSKFVKAMADKYNVESLDELIGLFK